MFLNLGGLNGSRSPYNTTIGMKVKIGSPHDQRNPSR